MPPVPTAESLQGKVDNSQTIQFEPSTTLGDGLSRLFTAKEIQATTRDILENLAPAKNTYHTCFFNIVGIFTLSVRLVAEVRAAIESIPLTEALLKEDVRKDGRLVYTSITNLDPREISLYVSPHVKGSTREQDQRPTRELILTLLELYNLSDHRDQFDKSGTAPR
jgi:hypothetical protein